MTFTVHDCLWPEEIFQLNSTFNIAKYNSWFLCTCISANIYDMPSVLWRCSLGSRKGIWPVKSLSGGIQASLYAGSRCRFAYGPADATATHYLLLRKIQTGFTFLVLPFWCRLTQVVPDKIQEGRKMLVCVCVCVWYGSQKRFTHGIMVTSFDASTKFLYIGPGEYWNGWLSLAGIPPRYLNSPKPTQLHALSRTGNKPNNSQTMVMLQAWIQWGHT